MLFGRILHEQSSHVHNMFNWVGFGKVVSKVVFTFVLSDPEFLLAHLVTYPVVTHVDCSRSFLFDIIIGDANCTFIVRDDRSAVLWMSKVM